MEFDPAEFDPKKYGPDVARILALDGGGRRLLPLTCGPCTCEPARRLLNTFKPGDLFPDVQEPGAPMAGLWLYFSCFEEGHKLVDSSGTPDGQLWHAILHRQEPDSGNAAYWFRQVGRHPVYSPLAHAASAILKRIPEAEFRFGHWDPYAFIAFCERARQQPASAQDRAAAQIQLAEWQLVFDHTARPQ